MAQFIICTSGGGNFLRRFSTWTEAFNQAIDWGWDGNRFIPNVEYISLDAERDWTIQAEVRVLKDDGRISHHELIPLSWEWESDTEYEIIGADGRVYEQSF